MESKHQKLIQAATYARENAYAPYSKYRVGAAVETEDGHVFTGCNVENIAYGSTMCAERIAIFKAISEGHTNFTRLAVVVDSEKLANPCGACRQVVSEFAPDVVLITANLKGHYKIWEFRDIFPQAFSKDNLR